MNSCNCNCNINNSIVYPLQFPRGDTYEIKASYSINGAAINLDGATIWMTAKYSKRQPDSEAVFQIGTFTGDIVVTDAAVGNFSIIIPIGATYAIPDSLVQPMVYSVVIELPTDSSGKVARNTVMEGPLNLSINVTDSTTGSHG